LGIGDLGIWDQGLGIGDRGFGILIDSEKLGNYYIIIDDF